MGFYQFLRDIYLKALNWIFTSYAAIAGQRLDVYNEEDYKKTLFRDESSNEKEEQEDVVLDPKQKTTCEHRIGTVTKLEPHGMIDGRYYFNTTDLQQKNIAVGQSVQYLAYRLTENADWTIKQIRVVERDEWDNDARAESPVSRITGQYTVIRKTLIAVVDDRRGRTVTMEPNSISCNLDSVQSEFLPVKGDSVSLTAIVEHRDDINDVVHIVDIELLRPLRTRTHEGKVSHLSGPGNTGIIDSQIFFTNDVCDNGVMPAEGDTVVVRAIESKQDGLTWRAIHLIIMASSVGKTTLLEKITTERLFDSKHKVVINAQCDKKSLKKDEKTTFKVKIENAGTEAQTLTEVHLMHSKFSKVMKLTTEFSGSLTINGGCFEELEILATARSPGQYSEMAVFRFKGDWEIGTLLDIYVNIEEEYEKHLTTQQTSTNDSNNYNPNTTISDRRSQFHQDRLQRQLRARTMATKTGFVVPGVGPLKLAAFIPKSLPLYLVPEDINNLLLFDGVTYRNKSTIAAQIEERYPCLAEQLMESNYTLKFHTLLHMEDVEHLSAIRIFDKDRVSFTRRGEYLVLEILNLSECKPSLIVGDRLHASEITTKESSRDVVTYEGCIHKVTSNSILLKFNESFHNQYDGKSMKVSFFNSRTTIRRAHQALNEVYKNLGKSWLFPNALGSIKPVQVNVVGEWPFAGAPEVEHVCESDPSSEQSVPKEQKKVRKPPVHRPEKRVSLAMFDDGEFEEDTVEKPPVKLEPAVHVRDDSLPTHSYASMKRPSCADKEIKWEEDQTRKKTVPQYAEKNTPPKPVEETRIVRRDMILRWVNPTLNKYQKIAVRNILDGVARPLPYIIHGPPGTGKTVTIVETILQIMFMMKESRILVATPSNSSADLLCERLLSWKLLQPGDLVRLVSYNYMLENRMSPFLRPYCTCIDMRSLDKNAPEIDYDGDGVKHSSREVIGRHRITVSTCTSSGNLYTMGFPKDHFTHVIIDEAGQSMEPEIMIPLAFLSSQNGQAILAGDPRQLGPVVMSTLAGSMGLSNSLLSRLYTRFPYHCDMLSYPETHGYDPRLVTRLLYNYRSLPNILELYSSLFYNNDLIPKICPQCSPERKLFDRIKDSLKDSPSSKEVGQVIFYGVKGIDRQEDDSPSWYNDHEIAKIVGFLLPLYNECGLTSDDIGIVTPYQKQVSKIRETMKLLDISSPPKVGTVEEFQGQERNVIIVSTVRSNENQIANDLRHSLGFVSSQARLNVAISRARAVLIIVGNPYLLSRDSNWATLLKLCVKRGYYDGCDLPVTLLDQTAISPFKK